ncbi:hypothetical protein L6164_013540 [Bauhinia variegata]|uniref:Uncharacterized protein n=1 Tax=Bauhinia variegata TaxID=167791 RepID=A0ACB9NI36_BAUVA|nr:hypothetical protein L6164_013540 [Bauhinia variegata]
MAIATTSDNIASIIHLNALTHLPIKLTAQNFPVWRKQLHSTLIGHNILHHIDGLRTAPSPLLQDNANAPNPEYLLWYRQDQILLSVILGSCSETIQPLISSADTAREAWDRLTISYANSSRSRIISLKSKLAQNSQGTKFVAAFLTEMQNIADDLALTQHPVAKEDLIVHILTTLHDKEVAAQPALATVHATQKQFPQPYQARASSADTHNAPPHYPQRRNKGCRGTYQGRP